MHKRHRSGKTESRNVFIFLNAMMRSFLSAVLQFLALAACSVTVSQVAAVSDIEILSLSKDLFATRISPIS